MTSYFIPGVQASSHVFLLWRIHFLREPLNLVLLVVCSCSSSGNRLPSWQRRRQMTSSKKRRSQHWTKAASGRRRAGRSSGLPRTTTVTLAETTARRRKRRRRTRSWISTKVQALCVCVCVLSLRTFVNQGNKAKMLMCCFLFAALQHAGKHMEDSIVASYTALLLGCLCQGSPVRDTHTLTQVQMCCFRPVSSPAIP